MKRLLLSVLVSGLAASAVPALVAGPAHAAQASPGDPIPLFSAEGTYVAATPTRVFDSRRAGNGQLQGGQSVTVPVLGRAGVPSTGVSAVVINLTATRAAQSGYLTAYPSTSSPGGTSNVIFAKGETRASLVTVPVGSDGSIKVLDGGGTKGGPVDAVVDIQGYYQSADASDSESGASFQTDQPSRLLDTRTSGGAVAANGTLEVTLSSDDEASGATALAVNLTAVSPTAPGYLTAWDGTSTRPSTSNLNFVAGQTTPNNAVVPLTTEDSSTGDGTETSSFSVYNGSAGATQVVVDVVGAYFDGPFGLRFQPLDTPVRIVDSRTGTGTTQLGADSAKTVQAPSSVRAAGDGDNADGRTDALVGTLTAVRPTMATYLTVFPTGGDRPEVSNLNPSAGQTVANHLYAGLSTDGQFDLYNYRGTTDALVDVTGGFQQPSFGTGSTSDKQAAATRTKARTIEAQRDDHPVTVVRMTRSAG